MTHGTVRFFRSEEGWGAIGSAELPGGHDAWVHFSAIEQEGFRELAAGEAVEFGYEPADQDGYRYRATWVRKA